MHRAFAALPAILLAVALGTVGCQLAASTPPPSPTSSKACGGFHLAIENDARTAIQVGFNGEAVADLDPGQTADIAEWGNRRVPLMPWDVEVRRTLDHVLLVAVRVIDDGTDGRRLTVTDPASPTAALAAYRCGVPASGSLGPSATTSPIGQFGGRAVLGISNGTSLAVTLYVNGRAVGTATPGVGLEPLDFDSLPPLPWAVEARSSSGRVLTSMAVGPDSVAATTDANGNVGTKGAFGRVDLSCGRITIWAGYFSPSGPVPPSPAGSPGDCVP